MSISQFKAEDWVYIADSMGRIGQGYYKNRSNPRQTMTVAQFERRRAEAVSITEENKEQNINNIQEAATPALQDGMLATASTEGASLSPWDNPVAGEQAATSGTTPAQKDTREVQPVPTPQAPETTQASAEQDAQEEQKKPDPKKKTSSESGGSDATGGTGSGGDAKVVCSELVRQGLMSQTQRRACTYYAYTRLPDSFMVGYHFWAVSYVRLMRKSAFATAVIKPIVDHRTREIRYRLGQLDQGSFLGRLICRVHDPLCTWIGRFVHKRSYHVLYATNICAAS